MPSVLNDQAFVDLSSKQFTIQEKIKLVCRFLSFVSIVDYNFIAIKMFKIFCCVHFQMIIKNCHFKSSVDIFQHIKNRFEVRLYYIMQVMYKP